MFCLPSRALGIHPYPHNRLGHRILRGYIYIYVCLCLFICLFNKTHIYITQGLTHKITTKTNNTCVYIYIYITQGLYFFRARARLPRILQARAHLCTRRPKRGARAQKNMMHLRLKLLARLPLLQPPLVMLLPLLDT